MGSSEDAVARSLERIAEVDEELNALIVFSPKALEVARRLDEERRTGQPRSPLHGVPIVVKDNIATVDFPTTAGSLALEGVHAVKDATVVERLRAAGLVLIGKSNLSEWANFRGKDSVSGWSAVGGQTRNAVDPKRTPCGSSSGSAVAVASGMVPLALGTETDGSIACPAAMNGIVGFKPTVGRVPGDGVVPLSTSQDSVGPMAKSVGEVAQLFAILGGEPARPLGASVGDGFALGVARNLTGYHAGVDELFEETLRRLEEAGVELDEVEIPRFDGDAQTDAFYYEMREALPYYLAEYQPDAPVATLADVVAFNETHAVEELGMFGQEYLVEAVARAGSDGERYGQVQAARAEYREELRGLLEAHGSLVIAPTTSPPWPLEAGKGDDYIGGSSGPSAVAGFPLLTIPMGTVDGLPVGLSIMGLPERDWAVLDAGRTLEALLQGSEL